MIHVYQILDLNENEYRWRQFKKISLSSSSLGDNSSYNKEDIQNVNTEAISEERRIDDHTTSFLLPMPGIKNNTDSWYCNTDYNNVKNGDVGRKNTDLCIDDTISTTKKKDCIPLSCREIVILNHHHSSLKSDGDCSICSICLSPYKAGESIVWSSNPKCQHMFHKHCLMSWFSRKRRSFRDCPCCRQAFVLPSSTKTTATSFSHR